MPSADEVADESVCAEYNAAEGRPLRLTTGRDADHWDSSIEHDFWLLSSDASEPRTARYLARLDKHERAKQERERREQERWEAAGRPLYHMMSLDGPDLNVVEKLADEAIKRHKDDGSALISIMFCHPRSVVFRDLNQDFAYLDRRSGVHWDLFFAGYSGRRRWLSPRALGVPIWKFSPSDFDEIRRHVERLHREALSDDVPDGLTPWRYSGVPELVSVMAYRATWTDRQQQFVNRLHEFGERAPGLWKELDAVNDNVSARIRAEVITQYTSPVKIDWASLHAVRLTDLNGAYENHNLATVAEILSGWREDADSPCPRREFLELAPGEVPSETASLKVLHPLLQAAGAAIAGGVTGNAAYDLIKKLIGI
ncbi:hypothetical protein [Streptosporangium sp. NPDC002524]|uniref:hypothetical protein n=1 Tax=Streptosporangium sp. NPDC002524 TaxID=3154537 RepID=UPI0033219BDC